MRHFPAEYQKKTRINLIIKTSFTTTNRMKRNEHNSHPLTKCEGNSEMSQNSSTAWYSPRPRDRGSHCSSSCRPTIALTVVHNLAEAVDRTVVETAVCNMSLIVVHRTLYRRIKCILHHHIDPRSPSMSNHLSDRSKETWRSQKDNYKCQWPGSYCQR